MHLDDTILKLKLNKALETIRKEPRENLQKRLSQINVNDLQKSLRDLDADKIRQMFPDAQNLKSKVTTEDLEKLRQAAGKDYKELYEQAEKIFKEI